MLANLAVLLIASVAMFAWAAIVHWDRIGIVWISALSLYPILILIAWPLVTLLAYIGSRFRDLPNVLALVLQSVWFISPVYFEAAMFRRGGLEVSLGVQFRG